MDINYFPQCGKYPRSNTVSDLFQTPPPIKYPKRFPFNNGFDSNNGINSPPFDNLTLPSQHFMSISHNQYQLQKNKMQNSFQFPNGEEFTPKRLQHDLQMQIHKSNIFNSTEVSPFSPSRYENDSSMISLEPELIENIIVTPDTQASNVRDDDDDILLERMREREGGLGSTMMESHIANKATEPIVKPMKRHNSLLSFTLLFKKFKGKPHKSSNVDKKATPPAVPKRKIPKSPMDKTGTQSLQNLKLTEPIDVGKDIDIDVTDQSFMDSDLLFDSLLLKADKPQIPHILAQQPFVDLPYLDKETLTPEDSDLTDDENSENDISSIFDDSLISDFSLLGDMITLRSPPPRSSHRPKMSSIEKTKRFYHSKVEFKDFISRLNMDFENVIVTDTLNDVKTNCSIFKPQHITKRNVRFSSEVYISKVSTKEEYDRCDHIFLQNRQLLNNPGFVDAIKWEINEFKKNEMVVNKDSVNYTQFFM